MQELSLHILDIAQNSINAQASIIEISISEKWNLDRIIITIKDNGVGMEPSRLTKAAEPFYTTRDTRRVGLGLALFKSAAENCGGSFNIESILEQGTKVEAEFQISHIDRPPLGKMGDTLVTLIFCNPSIDFVYIHDTPYGKLNVDTRIMKKKIEGLTIDHPKIVEWIYSYINEGLKEIYGGVCN